MVTTYSFACSLQRQPLFHLRADGVVVGLVMLCRQCGASAIASSNGTVTGLCANCGSSSAPVAQAYVYKQQQVTVTVGGGGRIASTSDLLGTTGPGATDGAAAGASGVAVPLTTLPAKRGRGRPPRGGGAARGGKAFPAKAAPKKKKKKPQADEDDDDDGW